MKVFLTCRRVVIKSARRCNSRFGITKTMMPRIEDVILAKETSQEAIFEIYIVPFHRIIDTGTETRSKGTSKDKVVNYTLFWGS